MHGMLSLFCRTTFHLLQVSSSTVWKMFSVHRHVELILHRNSAHVSLLLTSFSEVAMLCIAFERYLSLFNAMCSSDFCITFSVIIIVIYIWLILTSPIRSVQLGLNNNTSCLSHLILVIFSRFLVC